MADDPKQLGFAFGVQAEGVESLNDVEKAYLHMSQSIDKSSRSISGSLDEQSTAFEGAEDAAEESARQQEKSSSKFQDMDDALRSNILSLDDLGLSWSNFIKFLGAVSVGAIILGVVNFFKRAVEEAMKFRREMAKLNEAFAMNAQQAREVSAAVGAITDRAGITREEAFQLTKKLLELGHVPGVVEKVGISLKELAKTTVDLAGATGTSLDNAAEFADQLIRINRIPAMRIRNIGAAIKHIADVSRLTADDLIGLNKNLEPLFAALGDSSAKAREDLTVNFMGLAGALSDLGIDAAQATSKFADMLDWTSESGQQALGTLANFTGLPAEGIEELIKTNPAKLFDEIAKSASGLDDAQLRMWGRELEESMGLGFVDLEKLRRFGRESDKTFEQRAAAAAAAAKEEGALAEKAAKRQAKLDAVMRKFQRMWENMLIRIGGPLADMITRLLEKYIEPMFLKFTKFMRSGEWEKWFRTTEESIGTGIKAVKWLGSVIGGVFEEGGKNVGHFASISSDSIEGFRKLFEGDIRDAGSYFKRSFMGMRKLAHDVFIGGIVRIVDRALGTDLQRTLDRADEKLYSFYENIPKYAAGAWEGANEAADSVWGYQLKMLETAWNKIKRGTNAIIEWEKRVWSTLAAVITLPFEIASEFVMSKLDELIRWIGEDIVPKIKMALPDDMVVALEKAGEAAGKRIEARERERRVVERAAGQVREAVATGGAGAGFEVTSQGGLAFPSKMQTNSPEQERLLQRQNLILEETRDVLKARSMKATPTELKTAYALGG